MMRNQQQCQNDLLLIKWWEAQQEDCLERAKIEVAQRLQQVSERQVEEHMLLERQKIEQQMLLERETMAQRMRLDKERMRLDRETAEHDACLEDERLHFEREAAIGEQVSWQVAMLTNVWSTSHNTLMCAEESPCQTCRHCSSSSKACTMCSASSAFS